ncbi:MAG: hypothetical protein GY862_31530 [Gammaproteobacteria bacterium]|nr:hypothetical protein [Gammaproteobacteria bacterium]
MKNKNCSFTVLIQQLETPWEPVKVLMALLESLKQALKAKMSSKGLLAVPPAWLGYSYRSWKETDAFDDLSTDCYLFAVIERYMSLRSQLKVKQNIDGLLFLNIDHFLVALQKRNDPVGYAVWKNIKDAIESAAGAGILTGGSAKKISNQTLLVFSTRKTTESLDKELILAALRKNPAWLNIRLFLGISLDSIHTRTPPDMKWLGERLQKAGLNAEAIQNKLGEAIRGLSEAGGNFRFKDLVDAAKQEVRGVWDAAGRDPDENAAAIVEEGNIVKIIKIIAPDTEHEEWQSWRDRIKKISEKIHKRRNAEPLEKVFREIVSLVEADEPVVQAGLAKSLGIPKNTINRYIGTLHQILGESTGLPS